jgi:hypothetical protein
MDLRVRLRIAYEVLKTLVEASWDTLDEYIHSEIIQGIESDIDLYFQKSKISRRDRMKKLVASLGEQDINKV